MDLSDRTIRGAFLLGTAAGCRTFTPAAVLVTRGRLALSPQVRTAVLVAAAGELVGDKLPFVPSRTRPGPFLGRIASGAFAGQRLGGRPGALAGAAGAAAGTIIGYHARRAAAARMPALVAALLEDTLAIGVANLAVTLAAG